MNFVKEEKRWTVVAIDRPVLKREPSFTLLHDAVEDTKFDTEIAMQCLQ